MREVNISLPDEMVKFVEKQVELGIFSNMSEAIKEALSLLDMDREARLERLRKILKPALEQMERGEYSEYSYEELMADLDKS